MNFLPRRRRKPEVIIVSLIDIFAILLIFVIVTTTFKSELPAVTIKLPDSKTAVAAEKGDEALRLSITDKEEIYLGAEKVSLEELRGKLEKLQKLAHPPKLALATDKRAPFGVVIAVLDALKQAGVKGDLTAFTEQGEKP
jgi:biopolymer transport protein ExbD